MFIPDYRYLLNAAKRQKASRMPLYESSIPESVMEKVLVKPFSEFYDGNESHRHMYFTGYCCFFSAMGYDTVSFERDVAMVLPDSGSLRNASRVRIKEELKRYPFDTIPNLFFERFGEDFKLIYASMPEGMRVVGGPCCGILDIALELVGYSELRAILNNDEKLFADIISQIGEMALKVWSIFILKYSRGICVFRVGDKRSRAPEHAYADQAANKYVMPYYKRIVSMCNGVNKPVLFHGTAQAFPTMDTMAEFMNIDAVHVRSGAAFSEWAERFGGRLALFGGLDASLLGGLDPSGVAELTESIIKANMPRLGFAFGTGGGIGENLNIGNYMSMVETARRLRGD